MRHGKRRRIIAICVSAFLFASLSLHSSDTGVGGYLLVINPGAPSSASLMKGWQSPLTLRELSEWAAGSRCVVDDDSEPVVDRIAAFVAPRGSSVTVGGLARGVRYRAWIDFVRIRYGSGEPPSMLKIFAAASGMEKRLVETLALRDCAGGYRCIELPVDITSRGSVELTFEEYSRRPGSWGVWDIIVTDGRELPSRGSIPGTDTINLEIMDRIVQ